MKNELNFGNLCNSPTPLGFLFYLSIGQNDIIIHNLKSISLINVSVKDIFHWIVDFQSLKPERFSLVI